MTFYIEMEWEMKIYQKHSLKVTLAKQISQT